MDLPLALPEGVRKAKLERVVAPELATLVESAPRGDGWLHELKFDGYRLMARLERGKVELFTRGGADWTRRIPALVKALGQVDAESALLDGELVAIDERGIYNFQLLQNSLDREHDSPIAFYAFDLLHYAGWDLRDAPCIERRKALAAVHGSFAPEVAKLVRFSEHVAGQGDEFFRGACALGVEGIVSKRADAPYRSGRGRDWVKVKCSQRQEFVIVGFTDPNGSRAHIGALLLGIRQGQAVRFAGKVGTGFSVDSLGELERKLAPLVVSEPTVADGPTGLRARGVHWVRPELVAEVSFSGITDDGRLRHPSFRGLREDKSAAEAVPEQTEAVP